MANTVLMHASQWPEPPATETYLRSDFTLDGRLCLLVTPLQAAAGRPWIWRTEFFGHEPQADLALLARGYHVAYMDVQDMYGSPRAIAHMDQFYRYLIASHHLAPTVVLEGFSRGGLYAFNFAVVYPERVAALYLDAPVLDIRSWPGGFPQTAEWAQCLAEYDLTTETVVTAKVSPVDNIAPIAQARIPIIAVVGDVDTVVPIAQNISVLEERYRAYGAPITVIHKPDCEHHPHSLPDPDPIVQFLLTHAYGA